MIPKHKSGSESYEDLFLQKYARLQKWALQIAGYDNALAEDLLHDAFIQFTLSRPDLEKIENLDGYLYTVISNLHLSNLRKATRRQTYQLSIAEYESAELGLRRADLRDVIQVQDELRKLCHFVCIRKGSAKAASVMLLRFFLGYFPSEITQILKTTPQAVRARLKMARAEAKAILDAPDSVKFFGTNPLPKFLPTNFARSEKDFLLELRETIFKFNGGECFAVSQLENFYRNANEKPLETKDLAHIVACRKCLDNVNRILNLPLLSERHPLDSSGNDTNNSGGASSAGNGGKNITMFPVKDKQKFESERREVFEHYSSELLVTVNGYPCGSQRINAEINEQTFKIDLNEPLKFIEIFSEQAVRLAILNIGDLPPEGDAQKNLTVNFSENRTLSMQFEYGQPWATLQVSYHDPNFYEVEEIIKNGADEFSASVFEIKKPKENQPIEKEIFAASLFAENSSRKSFFESLKSFLSPSFITAFSAILIIAALLITKIFVLVPKVSAAEILDKTAAAETSLALQKELVNHRRLKLEARNANGKILLSRHVEEWQSAERGLTVRRLFDDTTNRITAGEWTRSEGISTIYSPQEPPSLQLSERRPDFLSADLKDVWKINLSAQNFRAFLAAANLFEQTTVSETAREYLLEYKNPQNASDGISAASLRIERDSMRSVEQKISVRKNAETIQFVLSETDFDQVNSAAVNPQIFEPDAVFMAAEKTSDRAKTLEKNVIGEKTENASADTNANLESEKPYVSNPAAASSATAEFELEVLQALNSVNALSGDQISVNRTADGKISVNGVVDSIERKTEIRNALASVGRNSSLKINVLTAEEASRNHQQTKATSTPFVVNESVAVETDNAIAAAPELEEFYARQGLTGEKLEQAVRRFSNSATEKSREIRRRALAVKQIAGQFSPEVLAKMDEPTRSKWRKIISAHAQAIIQNTQSLQSELKPVFPNINISAAAGGAAMSDAEIINLANKLFAVSGAVDGNVRESFSLSNNKNSASVKTARFNNQLNEIISLAERLK